MKKLLASATGIAMLLVGCGGSGSSAEENGHPSGQIVTDNPKEWLSWADLQKIPADTVLKVRVSDHGTDVYERPVFLRSTYEEGGDKKALLEPAKGDSDGVGDSGSPVLYKGKVVGSIYGSADIHHIYARSIEQQMEATRGSGVEPRIVVSTTAPEFAKAMIARHGAAFASRYLVQNATKALAASRAPAVPPIAGRKFAANFLSGPDASTYLVAAFSLQLPNGTWLATGHTMGRIGARKLPVSMAYVDGRLDDGSIWAHPLGSEFGTLTNDTRYGSLIDPTANTSVQFPVTTKYTLDGVGFNHTHQVTADEDSNDEQLATEFGLLTGLYNELATSRKEMYGNAVLTINFVDGSTKVFNFKEDPNNFGQLQGTGIDVYFEIDFWVRDKLSSVVPDQIEASKINLNVSLTSGVLPAIRKKVNSSGG